MSKVVIATKPSFDLPVAVSLLGGEMVDIEVTYRYRSPKEYAAFLESAGNGEFKDRSDAEMVLDVAEGWNLDAPFTKEGIAAECERVVGLAAYIMNAYTNEYARVRRGN